MVRKVPEEPEAASVTAEPRMRVEEAPVTAPVWTNGAALLPARVRVLVPEMEMALPMRTPAEPLEPRVELPLTVMAAEPRAPGLCRM